MARSWSQSLRTMGDALIEVLRAEIALLGEDLGRTGRELLKIALLACVALAVLFWTVGAATLALVEILALWLPRWGATVAVVALFLAAIVILGLLVWLRVRKLEVPTRTVRRRLDEHLDWWQRDVLHPETATETVTPRFSDAGSGAAGRSEEGRSS